MGGKEEIGHCPESLLAAHLALDDFVHEGVDILGSEGMLEGGHLMDTAAQGPDI